MLCDQTCAKFVDVLWLVIKYDFKDGEIVVTLVHILAPPQKSYFFSRRLFVDKGACSPGLPRGICGRV